MPFIQSMGGNLEAANAERRGVAKLRPAYWKSLSSGRTLFIVAITLNSNRAANKQEEIGARFT